MTQGRENRFEKCPRVILGILWGVLTLTLCIGSFFVVKAVRDEAKRGVQRYIIMREPRPSSDIPKTPRDGLVALADGLAKRAYPYRIDADGYIIPSQVHDKPDLTVVFLGGSTTECMFMQEEERFPYLVGREMEKSLGLKVNTLNGGNAGNHTLHCTLLLEGKALQRAPQAVVLMECVNDLNSLMYLGDYWVTHISRGIIFDKEYNPLKTFILRHINGRKPLIGNLEDEFAEQRGRERLLEPAVLARKYRKNLELFVFLCRQHGITPVLMTQFNRFSEHPEENLLKSMHDIWIQFGTDYAAYRAAYMAMQDALRQVAAEQKVALIDLDRLVPKDKSLMYDAVHLNPVGARLVAGIIAERLPDILRASGALKQELGQAGAAPGVH